MGQTQQTECKEEIDVKALQDMYRKFVMECPSGVLFLHEFKRFFGVDPTGEASDYAESMFRAFDKNGVRKSWSFSVPRSFKGPQIKLFLSLFLPTFRTIQLIS